MESTQRYQASAYQEFLTSVCNDGARNLATRLVHTTRTIDRKDRLIKEGLPTFGCIATKRKHAEILKKEILRRIRQDRQKKN